MANPKIVYDAFVKSVKPDPKSTEQVVYMNGYIGESPIDGHIRVYSDEQLSYFTDIPKSSVLHAEQNSKEENPLGGSKLWIRYNDLANKGAAPAAGSFLEGDVYANYAANMYQPEAAPQAAAAPRSLNQPCISVGVRCPTFPTTCLRTTIPCFTRTQPTTCFTRTIPTCFTRTFPTCLGRTLPTCGIRTLITCAARTLPTCGGGTLTCGTRTDNPFTTDLTTVVTDPPGTTVINPGFGLEGYGTGAFDPYTYSGY